MAPLPAAPLDQMSLPDVNANSEPVKLSDPTAKLGHPRGSNLVAACLAQQVFRF
jgi:hypothetical protein